MTAGPGSGKTTVLVDRYLRERGQRHVRGGLAVSDCAGLAHTCTTPGACFGHTHRLALTGRACGQRPGADETVDEAEVVVLRHGIEPNSRRGSRPIPRQMVAYAPLPATSASP